MGNDYISRQKTLDEAQRIRHNLQMLDNTQAADKMLYGVWRLEMEIEKLPAEPVQEVVLCKNCYYGSIKTLTINGEIVSWVECTNPDGLFRDVPLDGYCCASAKRQDVDMRGEQDGI